VGLTLRKPDFSKGVCDVLQLQGVGCPAARVWLLARGPESYSTDSNRTNDKVVHFSELVNLLSVLLGNTGGLNSGFCAC
jgi:hypothetical protein